LPASSGTSAPYQPETLYHHDIARGGGGGGDPAQASDRFVVRALTRGAVWPPNPLLVTDVPGDTRGGGDCRYGTKAERVEGTSSGRALSEFLTPHTGWSGF